MRKLHVVSAALALAMAATVPAAYAQTPCVPVHVKHKKSTPAPPCDTTDLRKQIDAMQSQLDALKSQIAAQTVPAEKDPIATPIANQAAADAAAAKAAADAQTGAINDLKTTTAGLTTTVLDAQKKITDLEAPSAIHYKGILIQPGGFLAAESVFRTRTYNTDIATPFNATPYPSSDNYYITEFNGSARQSRLSLNIVAPFSWGKAGGYVETDFLGAGTTSNGNQTNSYVLRVRSAFGQIVTNSGFGFQAGQMFTLATEVKKGILAGPGAEALPPTIDPNYHVGFDYGRQYALRFAHSAAGGKLNGAIAVEGSQIVFTGSNAPGNFFFGGAGVLGGLYNNQANYSDNLAPDLHIKVTADPGLGHYELGGITRFFRDRIYPQTAFSTANTTDVVGQARNSTSIGAGVYASARVPVTKFVDVALKATYGKGIARYEASNMGDVTARPDGTLVPLKTGDGLFEMDLHPTKKLDIFFLAGAEYLQRTVYNSGTGLQVGYGGLTTQNDTACKTQTAPTAPSTGYTFSAGTCAGATRYLAEFTPGITYRFFTSPTKGRFQMQVTYSYLDRMAWQGYTGAAYVANPGLTLPAGDALTSAQGITNMVHTSFRYYLP